MSSLCERTVFAASYGWLSVLKQMSYAVPRMLRVLLLQRVSQSPLCVPCTKVALQFCRKVCCIASLFDVIDKHFATCILCILTLLKLMLFNFVALLVS